jgi:endo-1,4-beta-xylanase
LLQHQRNQQKGLPIYISEYDIDQPVDSIQRKIMEDQFTMFWNHPKIIGITYYGYIHGEPIPGL